MGPEPVVIGMGLFFIGLMVHLSLDFEVKISTNFLKIHPKAYEICIQLILAAMPLGFALSILPRWNLGIETEIQGIIIMFPVIWPFVIYGMHKSINEQAIRLGMTTKRVGIIAPKMSARLNILGWIISGLLILSSFYITQFSNLAILIFPLLGLGFIGIVSFDLFGSIFTLQRKPKNVEEPEISQEIS